MSSPHRRGLMPVSYPLIPGQNIKGYLRGRAGEGHSPFWIFGSVFPRPILRWGSGGLPPGSECREGGGSMLSSGGLCPRTSKIKDFLDSLRSSALRIGPGKKEKEMQGGDCHPVPILMVGGASVSEHEKTEETLLHPLENHSVFPESPSIPWMSQERQASSPLSSSITR